MTIIKQAEEWIKDLQRGDAAAQEAAVHGLYHLPPSTLPYLNVTGALMQIARHGQTWPARSVALKTLVKCVLETPSELSVILPAVLNGVSDPDWRVRMNVLSALENVAAAFPYMAMDIQTVLRARIPNEADNSVQDALRHRMDQCARIIDHTTSLEERLRAKAQPLIDFINAAAKLDDGYPDRYDGPRNGIFDAERYSWNTDWRARPGYTMQTAYVDFSDIAENEHGQYLRVGVDIRDHRKNDDYSAGTDVLFYEDGTTQLKFACHLIGEDLPRAPQNTMTVGEIIWVIARTYFHFSREQNRSSQIDMLAETYAPPPPALRH